MSAALPTPAGLVEAFWEHERALADRDLFALDRLNAPGPGNLLANADGLVVGHDEILAARARGSVTARRVAQTHVQVIDPDHALVVAVTEHSRGRRGLQTQLWARTTSGWVITATHMTHPSSTRETRLRRPTGDTLIPSQRSGSGPVGRAPSSDPLAEESLVLSGPFAAVDNARSVSPSVVRHLLDAGASLKPSTGRPGTARVLSGRASIGLGTDTGGSIRTLAAHRGLFGFRPTHGDVPLDGVRPLAPSFDTVGWLTRNADLLARVGAVLLPESAPRSPSEMVVHPGLVALAEPDVAGAVGRFAAEVGAVEDGDRDLAGLSRTALAFRTVLAWEAWRLRNSWLVDHPEALGEDTGERLAMVARMPRSQVWAAAEIVNESRDRFVAEISDRVLVVPTTAAAAAAQQAPVSESGHLLGCLAELAGLPALTLPLSTTDGRACGVTLLAAPGRDRDLLALASSWALLSR